MADNRKRKIPDSQVDAIKVPPHSLEAEQSVLGGLLLDNERWDTVAERVVSKDFYSRPHRLIFDAIKKHFGREQAARSDYPVRTFRAP